MPGGIILEKESKIGLYEKTEGSGKHMIKGISRQIIEVQETGSIYYERAYFVVKPEYDSAQRQALEKEALKVLRQIDAPSGIKKHGRLALKKLLWMILATAVGALFTFGIMNFV